MATPKYHGSRDFDGTALHWNVHPGGLPVRTPDAPTLIDKDQLAAATSVRYFRSEFFNLPEDNAAYSKVMDWCANGMADLYKIESRPVDGAPGRWVAWVQWIDVRGVIPVKPGF